MSECQAISHLIGPYLYDDVTAKERAALESHLQQCAACRAEVEALRGLISAIPRDTVQADPTAKARTLHAVQSRIAEEGVRRQGRPRWREVVCAAALVAGAALFLGLWATRQPPQVAAPPVAETSRAGSRRGPGVAPQESAAGDRRGNGVAPSPDKRRGEQVAPTPPHRPARRGRTPRKQVAPPVVVQAALVAPAPIAAPAVTGVDDVTRTSAAPGRE